MIITYEKEDIEEMIKEEVRTLLEKRDIWIGITRATYSDEYKVIIRDEAPVAEEVIEDDAA